MIEKELEQKLKSLPEWNLIQNKCLGREFRFPHFREAFSFMTEVALVAEKMNHHPDWSNSYNKVFIELFTHDKQSLTDLDFNLAGTIDQIYASRKIK